MPGNFFGIIGTGDEVYVAVANESLPEMTGFRGIRNLSMDPEPEYAPPSATKIVERVLKGGKSNNLF